MKSLPKNSVNSGVGLVMEIEVVSLPREAQAVIGSVWDYPQVFPVAQFNVQVQRLMKLYPDGALDAFKEIDTTGFEYVALVKTVAAETRERTVVAGPTRHLDCVLKIFNTFLSGKTVPKPEQHKAEKALGALTRASYQSRTSGGVHRAAASAAAGGGTRA